MTSKKWTSAIVFFLTAYAFSTAAASDWYVKVDGNDLNDGRSWASARRTIQSAMDAANPGDVVNVAAGTYDERLEFKNGITLMGEGAGTTRIEYSGSEFMIEAKQIQSGKISGFTIEDKSSHGRQTIHLEDSSFIITENIITGVPVFAIAICGESNAQITNNEIKNNPGGSIFLFRGAHAAISGNFISNNVRGIVVEGDSSAEILNNEIRNQSYDGVYLYKEAHGTISGNVISYNEYSGILLKENSDPQITNNEIKGNKYSGIYVRLGGRGTISGNIISDNQNAGIRIIEYSDPRVTGNKITGNKGFGIYIEESLGMVSENTISENEYSGIIARDSSDPEIKDNEIKDNKQFGVFVFSGCRGKVSGNIISGNGSDGFDGVGVVENCAPQIMHNTIVNNQVDGIWVAAASIPTVRNNIIVRNGEDGIDTNGYNYGIDGDPKVSFNDIWGNGWKDYNGIDKPETDISVDPLFIDFSGGDYHLQPDSPCRGAADDGSDLGAYNIVVTGPWDVNKDGKVDLSDLALVGEHFGETITTPLDPNPDVNGDGEVDIYDLVIVAQHFDETYSWASPSEYMEIHRLIGE